MAAAAGETAQAVPRLTVGVVRGCPGRTVEVPVSLRYGANDLRDVVALQADVLFDATGVADGAPASGIITANHVLASGAPFTGTRRLLVYSPVGTVLTNGEVARIPYSVGPNEYRNFALRLTNVVLVRADASQVFGGTANGAIAVNQAYVSPGGQVDGFLNVASSGVEQCYVVQATTDFLTRVNVQTISTDGVCRPGGDWVPVSVLSGHRVRCVERVAGGWWGETPSSRRTSKVRRARRASFFQPGLSEMLAWLAPPASAITALRSAAPPGREDFQALPSVPAASPSEAPP